MHACDVIANMALDGLSYKSRVFWYMNDDMCGDKNKNTNPKRNIQAYFYSNCIYYSLQGDYAISSTFPSTC